MHPAKEKAMYPKYHGNVTVSQTFDSKSENVANRASLRFSRVGNLELIFCPNWA